MQALIREAAREAIGPARQAESVSKLPVNPSVNPLAEPVMRDVLVVFADAPEKRLLRWLKPGFRHCFVLMSGLRAGEWICLDPQSHRIACDVWQYSVLFDPEAHYRARGFDCVWVSYPAEVPRRVRLGAFTCVEFVKRLLGISGFWIVTPHQLFCTIKRAETKAYRGSVFFSEKCS